MSQLDGSSECDSSCIVSYCQFYNSTRCVADLIRVISYRPRERMREGVREASLNASLREISRQAVRRCTPPHSRGGRGTR